MKGEEGTEIQSLARLSEKAEFGRKEILQPTKTIFETCKRDILHRIIAEREARGKTEREGREPVAGTYTLRSEMQSLQLRNTKMPL